MGQKNWVTNGKNSDLSSVVALTEMMLVIKVFLVLLLEKTLMVLVLENLKKN